MKKVLSIILTIAMVFSISATAFASENDSIPAGKVTGETVVGQTFYYNAETGETVAENGEPTYFEEVEIRIPKSSTDTDITDRANLDETYIVRGGLYSTKSGTFTWFFNVDNPTSLIKKPHMKITVQLKGNFTDGTSFSNIGRAVYHEYTSNSEYGNDYTLTSTAKTGYYYLSYTIVDYDLNQTGYGKTNSVLFNRTGHLWNFYFSDTGKSLGFPRCDWPKGATSTRPSNLADRYYAEYKAATGKTLDPSKYDVHHIRPIAYGGDNSYSNLIHLPKPTHTSVSGWFNGY